MHSYSSTPHLAAQRFPRLKPGAAVALDKRSHNDKAARADARADVRSNRKKRSACPQAVFVFFRRTVAHASALL